MARPDNRQLYDQFKQPSQNRAPSALTPAQLEKLSDIKTRAGWIPVDQQLALAKSYASNEAVDKVADMNARQIIDLQGSDDDGGGILSKVYDKFKAATRWTVAGLNFVPEFVQGGIAQFGKPGDTLFQEGWFSATSLGSMIQNPELRGEGFFGTRELQEKQAEKARKYRGTVNGSAWTVGRGAANLVFKPDSLGYNIMSGVLDAAVMLKMDPTNAISKLVKVGPAGLLQGQEALAAVAPEATEGVLGKLKYGTLGRNIVPLLSETEVAPIREALEKGAGVTKGLARSVLDGTKFDTFSRVNPRMAALVDTITKTTDPVEMFERVFKGRKLPNELIAALSDANDPEVVRALLTTGWTVGRGGLPNDIRLVQNANLVGRVLKSKPVSSVFGDFNVDRLPLVDSVRKSRFFTTMGDAKIVVHGSTLDNTNAIKSMISYLRTAGADEAEVSNVVGKAIRAFTPKGTSAAQKEVTETFESVLRTVMAKDGIPKEAIDEAFSVGRERVDQIRRSLLDRLGDPTDNGYRAHLMNSNFEYIPEDEIRTLLKDLAYQDGDKLAIVSPTELVETLDRMIVLPDLREVRRLTRNKLFREVMPNVGKIPLTAKRQYRTVEMIQEGMEEEFDRLGAELKQLLLKKGKTDQELARIDEIREARQGMKIKERKKIITPEQRAGLAAVDLIQNELWKPYALATGGYIVRNSLDAQIRMAFAELPSLITHPFEYISLVLGTSKKMSLRLEDLVKVGGPIDDVAGLEDDLLRDVREAMSFGLRQQGLGEAQVTALGEKTGSFVNVSFLADGVEKHTDGMIQNARRSNEDTFRKIVNETFLARGTVNQETRQQAATRIVNTIFADPDLKREVDELHRSGFLVRNQRTGKETLLKVDRVDILSEEELRQMYFQYAMRIVVPNMELLTGNIPEAQFMFRFGYVPITDKAGKMTGMFESSYDDIKARAGAAEVKIGEVIEYDEGQVGVIVGAFDEVTGDVVIDPFDGTPVNLLDKRIQVQPVHATPAFVGESGSFEARALFRKMPKAQREGDPGLPLTVKRELMKTNAEDKGKWASFKRSYNTGTDFFFGRLVATTSRKLERSPVFREYYYRAVYSYADRLAPDAAKKLLDDIAKAAKEADMSPEKYVGDKKIIASLRKSTTTAGDVTVEELDDYAKWTALNQTKELLYDASERSNLEDVLRVIMPFAPAWREIITTYAGFLKGNPVATGRSFQRVYTGLTEADPENDGRGFFYEDPNTGQMMFMFPMTGALAKALTGIESPLEAPVRRLSQGIQAFPSLGPMGQVAASKILQFIPEPEFITDALLPYGPKGYTDAINIVPQWLQKATQAITAPTNDLESIFANTYIETYRALSASGDYDLSSKEDSLQLEEDAKNKARILTAFRALSQFTGPTAGASEFKIPTEQGDMYVSELIKVFYDMQADPLIGYDRAVPEFLEQFGDEALLYVSSKSRSIKEGLESTKAFQDWADDNSDFIRDYESVGRYFAPTGSDYDFTIWSEQIQRGERVRLTEREIKALAEQRVGASLYRAARRQIGPYPSEMAREALKKYRSFLHKKYPGFPEFAEFSVGAFYNDVRQLEEAVSDRRIGDNETAAAVREYLVARRQAIAASGVDEQGFRSAKSAIKYRDALEALGLSLADRVPNFTRVFERLLASEVE